MEGILGQSGAIPAMPWWGYVLLVVLLIAAAAYVGPRMGGGR
jgi:hypothetical protein